MAKNQKTANKPLEELLKQTLELNRQYMAQGFKMLTEASNQGKKDKNPFVFRPEIYSKAFKTFAKMNLDYYNRVMELGLSVADEMLNPDEEEDTIVQEPSFTLTGNGKPGDTVMLEFVLENTKTESVICELVNSPFMNSTNNQEHAAITLTFDPQSFTQEPQESHTVSIKAKIPRTTAPATYWSDVSVMGFEPIFFRVMITVDPTAKKTNNAKTKKRSTKKA